MKTNSKYSEILKVMRSDDKLVHLAVELKRAMERKGTVYKCLADEVLDDGVEVRALKSEATLKVKKQDEVTEVEELVTTLRQQCDVQVATAAVRLRKGLAATRAMLDADLANVGTKSTFGRNQAGSIIDVTFCSLGLASSSN